MTTNIKTPYFVIYKDRLEHNLSVLKSVMEHTGCKILLAQKCFSCYSLYPLVHRYLCGATASGIYEARLCHEEMPGAENHIFSPAFREEDFEEITQICDHIVFNSPRQLQIFGQRAKEAGMEIGLRINPECSTQEGHAIYDPCAEGSRLGTRLEDFEAFFNDHPELLKLLDGLHFHTLCEQDSDDLERTLDAVEEKFGKYLSGEALPDGKHFTWINFGGGHHITRKDYDIPRLERCIMRVKERYGLQVYLEPGEAVALNAGDLHTTVLEVQPPHREGKNTVSNIIVDTSAACHMPDVIEMPYTPPLMGAEPLPRDGEEDIDEKHTEGHIYRLGGPTCLSGDIIGKYLFPNEINEGDTLIFGDMAIYSMVKTNTFNGMPLPDIYINEDGNMRLWKHFDYNDFKSRV